MYNPELVQENETQIKLKESKKGDKYLDLARELKKLWNMKLTVINCNWCSWYSYQRISTGTGELGNQSSGDHPKYSISKMSQNSKKSPGDLLSLIYRMIGRVEVIKWPITFSQRPGLLSVHITFHFLYDYLYKRHEATGK